MTKILAISGSLRSQSSNRTILQAAIALAAAGVQFSVYEGIGQLPHFNPDLDTISDPNTIPDPNNPQQQNASLVAVQDWRSQLQQADAVLFCTPEYAHGVPGVLKNALDWIVSSGEFVQKPTSVISASPSPDGGEKANASLVQTLRMMMAKIDSTTILCIPAVSAKIKQGEVIDQTLIAELRSLLGALVRNCQS
jgi:chromate reductase, NAD(P)H dehydrogenase (quinone)